MSRILKAYRTRFRQLLLRTGARRPDAGVDWLVSKATRRSADHGISLANALTEVCTELASLAHLQKNTAKRKHTPADILFLCDGGMGGLARWLRAAGYRAVWEAGMADDLLLRTARETGATILTTDSMLMERRLLRDSIVPAFWLPPTLSISDQLEKVFCEFSLSLGTPRCMSCGGALVRTDKASLRDRIPPRTYRWLDEYFLCNQCGKLLWHGTHWLRVVEELNAVQNRCANPAPGSTHR
jgi:uncharacterized protein with PIN domain